MGSSADEEQGLVNHSLPPQPTETIITPSNLYSFYQAEVNK